MALTKQERRYRIKKRIRKIVSGTAQRPRLNVFRSNKQIYAQLIDDLSGKTISEYNNVLNNQPINGLSSLKSGVYFLKIIDENNLITTKLVKK